MTKSNIIHTRIEPALKGEAEEVLHKLGITPSQAVTMLYKAIAREQSLPLKLKLPNKLTKQTLEETDKGIDIIHAKDFESFCRDTGIDS